MKIKKRTALIWIVNIIAVGIFTTVIPTSVLADLSKQQNILTYNTTNQTTVKKTINQKQSLTDKVKKYIQFINPWQTSNLDQLGRTVEEIETSNNESAVHPIISFWSALGTIATNAYNNFGRTIGFTKTEKKQKEDEKETLEYNDQGRPINTIETLINISPTIPKENASKAFSVYDDFQRPINTQSVPTDIPAPILGQTVAREQIITSSPTTSPQRLENILPKRNILR